MISLMGCNVRPTSLARCHLAAVEDSIWVHFRPLVGHRPQGCGRVVDLLGVLHTGAGNSECTLLPFGRERRCQASRPGSAQTTIIVPMRRSPWYHHPIAVQAHSTAAAPPSQAAWQPNHTLMKPTWGSTWCVLGWLLASVSCAVSFPLSVTSLALYLACRRAHVQLTAALHLCMVCRGSSLIYFAGFHIGL